MGPATRARMTVSNFHSFCQHVLTESAADAGLPARPTCSTASARCSCSGTSGPSLDLRYHTRLRVPGLRGLHQPGQGRAGHARTTSTPSWPRSAAVYEAPLRRASTRPSLRLETQGNLEPLREVRGAYAEPRARTSAPRTPASLRGSTTSPTSLREGHGPRGPPHRRRRRPRPRAATTSTATDHGRDRRPRRRLRARRRRPRGPAPRPSSPASTAPTRRRWPRRGALDFGEQIALVARLFKTRAQRPPPLAAPVPLHPGGRVPGRQRRPDRADRAARPHAGPPRQRDGRGRRRPVHLPLPRRQLRRLRGVRRPASPAARHDPDAPPGPRPPRIEQNFRSVGHVSTPPTASSAATRPASSPDKRLRTDEGRRRPRRAPRLRRRRGRGRRHRGRHPGARRARRTGRRLDRRRRPVPQAQAPRRHRGAAPGRGHPVHRRRRPEPVRGARDPGPGAGACAPSRTPTTTPPSSG